MTSTQHEPEFTEMDPIAISLSPLAAERSPQPEAGLLSLKSPGLTSIGVRLFLLVLAGALIGLGGMVFFYYGSLNKAVKAEIEGTLADKVNMIDGDLRAIKAVANNLATSVSTLHMQKAQYADTYKRLTFEFFKQRPEAVTGLGFGQKESGVLTTQKWFSPYHFVPSTPEVAYGKPLSPPYAGVYYADEAKTPDRFYPESDYWNKYIVHRKPIWTEPEPLVDGVEGSFSTPIIDDQGQWLGAVKLNFNSKNFDQKLEESVTRGSGNFALLTGNGRIISYPADPQIVIDGQSYRSMPELKTVWSQVKQSQPGLLKRRGRYWSYRRIPTTNWIALASVPTSVVIEPLIWLAMGGTAVAVLFSGLVSALSVRYLNRRLSPMLAECNRQAAIDAATLSKMQRQDELDRLSTAFFNLLDRVSQNEKKIRQDVAKTVQAQAQQQQAIAKNLADEVLLSDVAHLQDIVAAVETGDLTVEAEVSPRVTGGAADAFNHLIVELRRIISVLMSTAHQVTQEAGKLETLAESTVQEAQYSAQSAVNLQPSMTHLTDLAQTTTQQAVATDEALDRAQGLVLAGQEQMTPISTRVASLQQGTEQMVKRLQTLTDYLELAAQFTQDQKRSGALTRVLALNASMLASRASEQQDPAQLVNISHEFATIATQVNELASQTNQGVGLLQQQTDQIQTVVSGLHQDIDLMNRQVADVGVCIGQSNQIFEDMQAVTQQVAQVGQQVIDASRDIEQTAQTTLQSLQDIGGETDSTAHQVRLLHQHSDAVGQTARDLLAQIQFFQISDPHQGDRDSRLNLTPQEKGHITQTTPIGSENAEASLPVHEQTS